MDEKKSKRAENPAPGPAREGAAAVGLPICRLCQRPRVLRDSHFIPAATQKPILERRKVLERILKPAAGIQLGSYVEAEGKALFETNQRKRDGGNAELTADDQLRQTTFLGWRDDKKAQEVVLEEPRTGPA